MITATVVIMARVAAYGSAPGIRANSGARSSAIFAPPSAPETIPMRVMPIWIVERNFSGSSSCFSTPLARLFTLLTRVSSRALLDDTSAISYMAKMPFYTN